MTLVGAFALVNMLLIKHITTMLSQNRQLSVIPNKTEISAATPSTIPLPTSHDMLALETIFDDVIETTDQKSWKLVVGGDYNPGRQVNVVANNQDTFGQLLENLGNLFTDADIAMVNLEGALVANCPLLSDGMKFCGNLRHVDALKNAGIDVVSLANNHSLNFGSAGLLETKTILDQGALHYVGFDEIAYLQVKDNVEVAIVGIDATLKERNPQEIIALVSLANKRSPVVIPYFHWGSEYTHDPNQHQQDLAHAAIEAGAALVLGSHPHWVQAIELYNQKLIVYSHGNLVFDQFWSEKTRQGIVGEYIFIENSLVDVRFQPIYIGNEYKPHTLNGEVAQEVINQMLQASERLDSYE